MIFTKFIDIFMHLDQHLQLLIQNYGVWTYSVLVGIVFCETAFVVTPFLPGDSLLFTAGAIAALGSLNVGWLWLSLCVAAIAGDTVNYWIGSLTGQKIFETESRFIKREHLIKTQKFYDKYGAKTIVLARFVPIVRTFAPFVAGIGKMNYWKFISYNVVGGIAWISICLFSGYFLGNIPAVKRNFSVILIGIVIVSILPMVFEFIMHKTRAKERSLNT